MNVLDIFSGIGGFSLGLERAGMRTRAFCEVDPFCREWLAQQWPGIPCYADVRELRGDAVGPVDLIAGGFPCQDISAAGKGAGIDGARSGLWREMHRIVLELRPDWVLAENVSALRTRGADRVLGDLEAIGYACWPFVVGADDVGAPHKRKRVWIVAHAQGERRPRERERRGEEVSRPRADGTGGNPVADSDSHGIREQSGGGSRQSRAEASEPAHGGNVAHGNGNGRDGEWRSGLLDGERAAQRDDAHGCNRAGVALDDAERAGLEGYAGHGDADSRAVAPRPTAATGVRWPAGRFEPQHAWEPPRVATRAELVMGGDFDGLPVAVGSAHNRARLKALGNSIVPQIAETIGRAIMRTAGSDAGSLK